MTTTLALLKEVIPALQVREEKLKAAMTEEWPICQLFKLE